MLILTRREAESILIDGEMIKIEVLKVMEDKVKLGIKAPKEIAIHRAETLNSNTTNESKSITND